MNDWMNEWMNEWMHFVVVRSSKKVDYYVLPLFFFFFAKYFLRRVSINILETFPYDMALAPPPPTET